MRYKVKAETLDMFREVRDLVSSEADLLLESERRMVLSAESLSDVTKAKIEKLGAKVGPEYRYDLDPA